MKLIDLTTIIKQNKNQWVALTPDNKKMVAAAKSLSEVLKISSQKGIKDPSVFKSPTIKSLFIG